MRILMNIKLPTPQFNEVLKSGSVTNILNRIIEEARPESIYFTEQDGQRSALMVVNIDSPSDIPRFAEPWFLSFHAKVEFSPVMTPDDLRRSGVDELGKKWSL